MQVQGVQKIWLNGELIKVDGEDGMSSVARSFMEFAKGKESEYPTFEDAVLVHKHVEALKRSAAEGKKIEIDSL